MNNNDEFIACPKCGTRLSSKATFCGVCGYNFATNSSSNIEQNNNIPTTNTENFTNNNSRDFVGDFFSAAKYTFLSRVIGKILSFLSILILGVIFLVGNGGKIDAWIVLIGVIVVLLIVVVILSKLKRR